MSTQKEDTKKEASHIVDPKIEAIKEIIFGENIKEYESEFKKLSEVITKHKSDLEVQLNEFRNEANASIKKANEAFLLQLTELKKDTDHKLAELNKAKLNKQEFGNLLKKLGEEIQA